VAIGSKLAEKLSIGVGDNLTLLTPRGPVTPVGIMPRIKAYKVAAVFEIGMFEFDTSFVFMPLTEAQAYFDRTCREEPRRAATSVNTLDFTLNRVLASVSGTMSSGASVTVSSMARPPRPARKYWCATAPSALRSWFAASTPLAGTRA